MPSTKVIIDTNFFLLPFQHKVDLFGGLARTMDESYQCVISSRTIKELEKIAQNKGKTGAEAKLGLKIFELNKDKVEIIESDMPVDPWIVKYAVENRCVVCTCDKALKNKLTKEHIRVITRKGTDQLGFV